MNVLIADVLTRGVLFDPVPKLFTWPEHPDDDHLFNLAIFADAKYLVTWERRIRQLAAQSTTAAELLRTLAPSLEIVSPEQLAGLLRGR